VWNEEGASIRLTVTPPWWQTWKFGAVALSAIVAGLVMAYRLRIQYVVERSEALAKEVVERREVETALRASHEKIRSLASKLMSAQEEESKRIARDLHDDITQRLAALGIDTEQAIRELDASPAEARRQFRDVQEKLALITSDIHKFSRQLHPSLLDDLGVVNAVRSECHDFSRRYDTEVDFVPLGEVEAIPRDVSLTVYRIVQEGLRNAAKYADAKGCRVEITVADGTVCVTVKDDGKGFDLARHPRGLGLASLKERVKLCGGDLEVQSSSGAGTRIFARMPLEWEPR
jgi:signal transduction histidine kinase